MPDQFLSIAESADYLGCTTKTIRRMISRGELPAVRIGSRMIRIQRADLDKTLRPIPTARRSA